jgi:peptidoglycan/LPS O-acetylase OafA/YrhL
MTTIVTPTPTAVASPSARRGKSFYRPELDVLRFFAFFSVFLYHFWRPTELYVQHGVPRIVAVLGNGLIQGGVFGVDLFFVLSAYLITELLLREKDECGSLDVRGFYLRRILRIWPLYFFYIGLALLPIFNQRHGFTWHHAAAFVLLAGNWSVIAWGWPSPSIVVPLWTVSIEEQFYLAWPPIVRRLSRSGIAWAAVGMLVVSNATRIAMVALHGGMNSVWCNTFSRLDPIVAGILIALVLRGRIPNFNPVLRAVMLACGIVPLALVSNYWHIHEPQRLEWIPTLVGFPVVAVSCSLIMLAVLGVSLSMPRFLVYLGKISYGLYVYHPLGNLLSGEVMRVHSSFLQLALRPIAALATTVLLAAASYAFLEKPFLRLKQRFAHIDSRPV